MCKTDYECKDCGRKFKRAKDLVMHDKLKKGPCVKEYKVIVVLTLA